VTQEKYSLEEIKEALYGLDWIQIMKESVETRPSSWGVQKGEEAQAVSEWRNASDTLMGPVYKSLETELNKSQKSGVGDSQ